MKSDLIYILEDDLDIGDLMSIVLDDYQTKIFTTVARFEKAMADQLPTLLLLDIMLPDGNGLEICKQLKSDPATAHIPVILLSASYSTETVKDAGADLFISKPFDIYELKEKVSYFLDQSLSNENRPAPVVTV